MCDISSGLALAPRVRVANTLFDPVTETRVADVVRHGWAIHRGGSIYTVNVDIARAISLDASLGDLVAAGSLVVADGAPLIWASRMAGTPLPERVAGSSLLLSLSEAAAADGRSVFLLGGEPGVPEKAASMLQDRCPGLRIAGTCSPPFGFDRTETGVRCAVAEVAAAAPDLVLVGLGFPRQEYLIGHLRRAHPDAWYLGCGGAIPMAAGVFRRASPLLQRLGLEWAHRLLLEPRRLARRYLRDDLPFAARLLVTAPARRFNAGDPRARSQAAR